MYRVYQTNFQDSPFEYRGYTGRQDKKWDKYWGSGSSSKFQELTKTSNPYKKVIGTAPTREGAKSIEHLFLHKDYRDQWFVLNVRDRDSFSHSPESNAKRAASNTGLKRTQETKDRISAGNRGKVRTPEMKKKNSLAQKASYANGRVPPRLGVTLSEEEISRRTATRKKNAEERGYYMKPESRKKMGVFMSSDRHPLRRAKRHREFLHEFAHKLKLHTSEKIGG